MEWIPVEERMPEEGQVVLVTVWYDWSYGKMTEINHSVELAIFSEDEGHIQSANGKGYFDTDNDWYEGQPCKVTAWAELPAPYKAEPKSEEAQ